MCIYLSWMHFNTSSVFFGPNCIRRHVNNKEVYYNQAKSAACKLRLSPAMVRTSRLAARILASADTKQLEKGLYINKYITSRPN